MDLQYTSQRATPKMSGGSLHFPARVPNKKNRNNGLSLVFPNFFSVVFFFTFLSPQQPREQALQESKEKTFWLLLFVAALWQREETCTALPRQVKI